MDGGDSNGQAAPCVIDPPLFDEVENASAIVLRDAHCALLRAREVGYYFIACKHTI